MAANISVLVGVVALSMVQTYMVTEGYKAAASLYRLAIEGTTFDVAPTVADSADWVFDSMLFAGCYITSANPSDVTVGTTTGQLGTAPVAPSAGSS
jgi:hypothetical protein